MKVLTLLAVAMLTGGCATLAPTSPVVTTPVAASALAQPARLFVTPAERPNDPISGRAFYEMAIHSDQWPTGVAKTTWLSGTDWALHLLTDDEQQAAFAGFRKAGLKLALEVPVLKDWCSTADQCYHESKFQWDRMLANGAPLALFIMDEPVTAVVTKIDAIAGGDVAYAIREVNRWIALAKADYPDVEVFEDEAYPAVDKLQLLAVVQGTRCDGISIDYDWRLGVAAMADDLATVERATHPRLFGLLLWPDIDGTAPDAEQAQAILTIARTFASKGVYADLYGIESWNAGPRVQVPETQKDSMSWVVKTLLDEHTIQVTR